MRTFNTSWEELRTSVKNCRFTDCPRNNGQKLPILFDRKQDSLSKIKFLVVSQEPGTSLKKTHNLIHSEEMENFLINDCLNSQASGTSPVNKMIEIFGNFDPSADEIYWNHALKCVPTTRDEDIKKEWAECAPLCANHFKEELRLIPSRGLAIIAFGNYALALCRHVLEDEPLSHTRGIMKHIRSTDVQWNLSLGGKEISFLPFIHPSNCNRVLRQHDKNGEVKRKQEEFVERIRQLKRQVKSGR